MRYANTGPRHWHLTRGLRDRGECAACDIERAAREEEISVTNIGHSPPLSGTPDPPVGDRQ